MIFQYMGQYSLVQWLSVDQLYFFQDWKINYMSLKDNQSNKSKKKKKTDSLRCFTSSRVVEKLKNIGPQLFKGRKTLNSGQIAFE